MSDLVELVSQWEAENISVQDAVDSYIQQFLLYATALRRLINLFIYTTIVKFGNSRDPNTELINDVSN